MFERRSLRMPIFLGVTMIVLLVALLVGWIILTVVQAQSSQFWAPLYWTLLTVGATSLVTVLVGVVLYLTLSVKAINLSRRQSNFIDSVTHELKSPIASLKLYLQTLSRHEIDPGHREKFYHVMLDDVDRLDQLINHLLDAARMERRQVTTHSEDVRLDGLLRQCGATVCFRYRVPPEVIQYELRPCIVHARRVDLEMIFSNLIDNAIKYASAEPVVEVALRNAFNGQIVVSISDNGRGIPFSDRRKIFGRFERLGSELERQKPGTGLGLYIVRTFVKRLRGRIRVRDRGAQSGTCFEIQLRGRILDEEPAQADDSTDKAALIKTP